MFQESMGELLSIKSVHTLSLTGFCKNHNTQHSLLKMLELWKEALDQGKSVGAIFIDLSKDFDTQTMTY